MPLAREIDIQAFIDAQPFSRLQWRVWALCFGVLILDGFDVVIIGFIAPVLLLEWTSTSTAAIGVVISAGLVGLAIGALLGGPLADRFGRRPVLTVSVLFFGLMSLASALSPDVTTLSLLRFLTGIGLGASQPTAAALASEYAPRKYRSLMVTTAYCGFAIGGSSAGLLASYLLAGHSWRWLLVIGGLIPLGYTVLLYVALPESVKFLAAQRRTSSRLTGLINRISPASADAGTSFTSPAIHLSRQGTIASLLSPEYRRATLAMWCGFFMNLLVAYFFNGWLPVLMTFEGFNISDCVLVGAMFQAGGILGIVIIGWEMDRFRAHRVLMLTLSAAAVLTLVLVRVQLGLHGFMALAFLLGYCINSANTGWTAMAANYYPTEMRATGISWMTGIARFGAVAGAYGGGLLLALHWQPPQLLSLLFAPLAVAVIAAGIRGAVDGRTQPDPSPALSALSDKHPPP
ncbi:MFS transporter [Pseudomonas sp. NPDC090202]|uniref:MFS transporter n=1 Tax=unclassified Pseudomonas TaxID=196821 RepID=UPI0038299F93